MFLSAFDNPYLNERHDGVCLPIDGKRVAMTTDSYVVRPLFFPGGDIGRLSVYGTVNDLAMCGAHPRYLSAGFILEEGLPMETLWRVVLSMKGAAEACGAQIVTGDTKVVDRGHGDGIFINTAGIGFLDPAVEISPSRVRAGDRILLSGDVGRHGIAVLSVREGMSFEGEIASDCAPLTPLVSLLLEEAPEAVHCLRDCTRGGLAAVLNEIAQASRMEIRVEESAIPVSEMVRGACELLGLDPLYVACEGRFAAFVSADRAERLLALLNAHPRGKEARLIGEVTVPGEGRVVMTSRIGGRRILDLLSGEQLPRIC
jgi:hydrogenase expression/formation protein HypE